MTAARAVSRPWALMVAVVTPKPTRFAMHSRPGITAGTFGVITALMAGQNRRKSASIQKHQGLFTALKGLTNRV